MRYAFQSLTDVIDLGNESPWCRVGGRDPVFERIERGLSPVGDTELVEDIGQVAGDGAIADVKLLADVPVRLPLGHQRQHLALAPG
jgi:hypothetical protein